MNQLTILTNDPSLTAWGWAIVEGNNLIQSGCIKTTPESKKRRIRKGDDTVRRVSEINNILLDICQRYKVNYILSELPHGSQSAVGALMIGITVGITQMLADCLEVGIEWYSEGDTKKEVLNKRSASKQEMIARIGKLYNITWTGTKYKDEAVADAMAIYHTAMTQSPTIKLLK